MMKSNTKISLVMVICLFGLINSFDLMKSLE